MALKVIMTANALYGEENIDELKILQKAASANPNPGQHRIV